MIVGFSVAGGITAGKASAVFAGPPSTTNVLDSWLTINADNTVTLYLGKEELGQGATTGLRQIAAEELNMPFEAMRSSLHEDTTATIRPGTGPDRRQRLDLGRWPTAPLGHGLRLPGPARPGLGEARRSGCEPHRRKRRDLGRRQDR